MNLADAKETVHLSRTWEDVRQRDDDFHAEIFGLLNEATEEK
jgi:hypothetical protein